MVVMRTDLPRRTFVALAALVAVVLAALATAPVSANHTASIQPGTPVGSVVPETVEGAQALPDGGWAVPLAADPPSWLTPELVQASRNGPVSAPKSAVGPDVPLSGYVGIRPGSEMVLPAGCTMNFIFQKNGVYAIGTAGHCVEKVGEPVTLLTIAPGTPPKPENLVLVTIGTVITTVDNGVGDDFALVSIKPELQSWVFPTIPVVAGPCGAYTAGGNTLEVPGWNRLSPSEHPIQLGETVWHYGHGVGIGSGGTPRSGVATGWTGNAFFWLGAAVFGDSGSAARTTGLQAAGDVTHLIVHPDYAANSAGTRISRMLAIANGWSLVNSPYCA